MSGAAADEDGSMKNFLTTVAGVLVGLTLFVLSAPIVAIWIISAAARPAPTPDRAVLSLDLRGALTDQPPPGPLAFLAKGQSVMTIEETLRRAGADDRIKGLFVRLPEIGMAPAAADELRLAFREFRAHGKFITAHAQGLYGAGLITSTYELAGAVQSLGVSDDELAVGAEFAKGEAQLIGGGRRHADLRQAHEQALDPVVGLGAPQRLLDSHDRLTLSQEGQRAGGRLVGERAAQIQRQDRMVGRRDGPGRRRDDPDRHDWRGEDEQGQADEDAGHGGQKILHGPILSRHPAAHRP